MQTAGRVRDIAEPELARASGYADERRPLRAYAGLTATFNGAFAGALVSAHRAGKLDGLRAGDIALAALATQKLSRLAAKDKVTSFLRAPFTRYEGPSGPSEVSESARGTGMRLALGELVSCPYCVAQWVAAGFTVGMLRAPRPTRAVASAYAVLGLADLLQLAYGVAEEKLQG